MGKKANRQPEQFSDADLLLFYTNFYGRMRDDIGRDIRWQLEHPNDWAGNVLCALGLVVYTEVLGRLAIEQQQRRFARNAEAFYSFLDRMRGGEYAEWRAEWQKRHARDLYDVLRNGLAHQYLPKVRTKLWFEPDEPFGLGEDPGFDLCLRIEPYHSDFCAAAEELFRELGVGATPAAGEDLIGPEPHLGG
jgi:hypothetical protein